MHVGGIEHFLSAILDSDQGIGMAAAEFGLQFDYSNLQAVHTCSVEGGIEQRLFRPRMNFVHTFALSTIGGQM